MWLAKKTTAKKHSLSAVVEEYLNKFFKIEAKPKEKTTKPFLIERIPKRTKVVKLPADYNYKKLWQQH